MAAKGANDPRGKCHLRSIGATRVHQISPDSTETVRLTRNKEWNNYLGTYHRLDLLFFSNFFFYIKEHS